MGRFQPFLGAFKLTGRGSPASWPSEPQPGWAELMAPFAGSTFENGLYRLHSPETSAQANAEVSAAHPDLAGRIETFGYDWLGRQFAIDLRAPAAESIRMAEPGTGEVLAIPASFETFHNQELIEFRDAALASQFFQRWAAGHPTQVPLRPDQCVGYRVPLFLGGQDELENLEQTDVWVYWSLVGQLIRETRGLPRGAPISRVTSE